MKKIRWAYYWTNGHPTNRDHYIDWNINGDPFIRDDFTPTEFFNSSTIKHAMREHQAEVIYQEYEE